MLYPSDLTDDQWDLPEPVFDAPGKRGGKHAGDPRSVVDAMLYTRPSHQDGRAAETPSMVVIDTHPT